MSTLLEQWRDTAYSKEMDKGELQKFWGTYFQIEKEIYEKLLTNPDEEVKGTVKELAEKYGIEVFTMTGFLDGINDSLKEPNPIETMDEDTEVSLMFDKELLYKNMVDAKADWLYELPQWEEIFSEEKRKELYKEQKSSRTVHVEKKVYPNDPCPCGSGKKYKKCCGKN
ncbi:SEC-C metal-binding domain-containing protein [Bariatricus massiliensis]|uniref:SEC-C domain-containing protein n=1 Tax=Bariatricus massiliensis TaxID=1745713 RepID=A0ABS8DB61_9FIRM|nr:SEC-C metal-binding domain-containing protein [Bariatricus massiliensis]MCB7303578.1 SEC-C domain-containing protein [Bariatricus massiliensis]MCB7372993.1 SEC-C domain-containing protein [Bariatricus massiliensis]MCB7385663.1 SEC-C domain-containing protein [Bariatricus massiliensis]MCB7409826.1 SEC-C domain-containing protein [Bariatricus massiliensis]MCQ5254064.1 SEC-C metal-binding domain-containing protein [Bariatricus massiliensis]